MKQWSAYVVSVKRLHEAVACLIRRLHECLYGINQTFTWSSGVLT